MGRINVISSIFEDSNVQQSIRDDILTIGCIYVHPLMDIDDLADFALTRQLSFPLQPLASFASASLKVPPLVGACDVGPKPT